MREVNECMPEPVMILVFPENIKTTDWADTILAFSNLGLSFPEIYSLLDMQRMGIKLKRI